MPVYANPITICQRILTDLSRLTKWADRAGTEEDRANLATITKTLFPLLHQFTPNAVPTAPLDGAAAFDAGISPYDNPFPPADPQHDDWMRTYNARYLAATVETNPQE